MLIPIIVTCIVVFVSMQLSSFATTIYLHRSLAHKGLRLHPAIAMLMRIQLWLFTGIVTREWVAVHRKHHHFADEEGDPQVVEKYTKDMPPTGADFVLNRGLLGLGTGLAIFIAGFTGYLHGWVGPVVGAAAFISQGVTYIAMNAVINGACHVIGYKNFNNTATNIRTVAWLSGGEGLHNNHHQYPAASKFSMRRWEFDPAWPVIKLLTILSLAKPLPLPQEVGSRA